MRQTLARGRLETVRVDLFLVEERVIEIAQFFLVLGELAIGFRIERLGNFVHARFAEDAQVLERAGGRTIGRDDRFGVPGAVDEHEKRNRSGTDEIIQQAYFGLKRKR